jgi:hypothetical protein
MPTETLHRPSPWPFIAVVTGLALALLPVAAGYLKRFSLSPPSTAGIYGCFLLLLTYSVAPAMSGGRSLFVNFITRRYKAGIIPVMLTLPYVCYSAGTADFRLTALGRLIAIVMPVILVYSVFPVRDEAKFNWQDTFVAIYLASIVVFHLFKGIWNVPVNLDFMGRLLILSLGALSWTFIRPVPDLGYGLECGKTALLAAANNFVFFAAIAIPLGLLLGFTSWNPRWHSLLAFLLSYLEIFLFVALLEELFFAVSFRISSRSRSIPGGVASLLPPASSVYFTSFTRHFRIGVMSRWRLLPAGSMELHTGPAARYFHRLFCTQW